MFNKFESVVGDSIYSQMMPLIRVSELYLMVSEIYYEQGQKSKGAPYFNALRENRGLSGVSTSSYPSYLLDEWWRVFIGGRTIILLLQTDDGGRDAFGDKRV